MRQNIALSLCVNALFVILTLAGHASLWAAIGADMGASLRPEQREARSDVAVDNCPRSLANLGTGSGLHRGTVAIGRSAPPRRRRAWLKLVATMSGMATLALTLSLFSRMVLSGREVVVAWRDVSEPSKVRTAVLTWTEY